MDLDKFRKEVASKKSEHKKFFDQLKKNPPKNLDQLFQHFHEEAFEKIDCLSCANCCKTTGPLFKQKDIDRLAAHLQLKPGIFIARYLKIDEDNDYVLQHLPCPFLGDDNYCSVYEARPNACRAYPHTDQRKMHTILKETRLNAAICPAVYEITENLIKTKK